MFTRPQCFTTSHGSRGKGFDTFVGILFQQRFQNEVKRNKARSAVVSRNGIQFRLLTKIQLELLSNRVDPEVSLYKSKSAWQDAMLD